MFFKHQQKFLIVILIILLAGCQQTGKPPIEVPPVEAKVDDISLNSLEQQNKQLNRAISLLEKGENTIAAQLIGEVLKFRPTHKTALFLKQQLESSSRELFNTQRFTQYKIKNGDSLGEIATKWLGNPLYFIALAKLNKIPNPSQLNPGSTIRIPLTQASDIIKQENRLSNSNLKLVEKYRKEGAFIKSLQGINNLFFTQADQKQRLTIQQQILQDYQNSINTITDRRNMISNLVPLLKKTKSPKAKENLQQFLKNQNRQLLISESEILLKINDYTRSAEKLVAAKQIKPSAKAFKIENLLVNKLHEQAMRFYKKHTLKEAIDLWDLVIKLQPENKLANKYLQRAQKLLKKLNQY